MENSRKKTGENSDEMQAKNTVTGEACASSAPDVLNSKLTKKSALKKKAPKKFISKPKKVGKSNIKKDETSSSSCDADTESGSESSSDDSTESSSTDDNSSSESEDSKRKRKSKNKSRTKCKDKKKMKHRKKNLQKVFSDSESESESESDCGSTSESRSISEADDSQRNEIVELQRQLLTLQIQNQQQQLQCLTQVPGAWNLAANRQPPPINNTLLPIPTPDLDSSSMKKPKKEKKAKKKKKRASKLDFKRIDQLWDSSIHDYKLTDTAEDKEGSEYEQYLFNVRRTFDWEGKYKSTLIDIKSQHIKDALSEVMDGVKGVSLVEDSPSVDPHLLFLYLEDLRGIYKNLKTTNVKGSRGKKKAMKAIKRNETKRTHLKVLLKYLDKDYATTKKTLYPMLNSGLITFDLLWALYKPNTLAYTTTYGCVDEPRVFKIELAELECSFLKGEWYNIEGRYLEYDGKTWGMGTMDCNVPSFKGARKITSLSCFPLKYHKNEKKLRSDLIERGKKFVSLQGVNYRSHKGMAFYKKRKQIVKVNIHGRIMIDPAIHRRILPNYTVSTVKSREPDHMNSDSEQSDGDCCKMGSSSDEEGSNDFEEKDGENLSKSNDAETDDGNNDSDSKEVWKVVQTEKEGGQFLSVFQSKNSADSPVERLEEVQSKTTQIDGETLTSDKKKEPPVFSDEEYLIASPVVLGFAFAEKLWLEFTVSGVRDITWNDGAYDSLVLEDNTKSIVKALVESHKYHPAESIDDVIQGKGKGLVAVLHGPPGTGKTLTAEGISELLKSPLYMVSAGELGTDPRTLEGELQKILDVAHAWGAVLLLDEADVFLEKRTIQDIHRNALVSIFLRLLEYFQGILFLTTNRVETFDDAFQSRIHIALRYGELSASAKKSVFKLFIERVRVLEGIETMPFTEEDLNTLSRNNLNGRQIKNTIRTAQALAVQERVPLSMVHIKKVLDMSIAFDRDLKGGPGFEEAMRGYF